MKIGIIGAGNMGGAIARGLAADPDFCTADITVCSPNNHGELDALKADYPDMNVDTDNEKAILGTDIIILAVKPWLMYDVMDPLSPKIQWESRCWCRWRQVSLCRNSKTFRSALRLPCSV